MSQDISDRITRAPDRRADMATDSKPLRSARILPLVLREPSREPDLFGRPAAPDPVRDVRAGRVPRPTLSRAESQALVRELHRLSEICDRHDHDQAAALIEVAALVLETHARFAPLIEHDGDPADPGLL